MDIRHVLRVEDPLLALTHPVEHGGVDLVLRHQVQLAGLAAQEVLRCRGAEFEGGGGGLFAEDDHVGEVGDGGIGVFGVALVFGVVGLGVFAEDAAGGEDGADGAGDEFGGVEGDVACVVLFELCQFGGAEL